MEGGRLLGNGYYGCAFTPELKCAPGTMIELKGNKKNGRAKVAKISTPEDSIAEFKISEDLSVIPGGEEYFILATSICQPANEQSEPELLKCGAEKIKGVPLSSLIQINMPLGGQVFSSVPAKQLVDHFFGIVQHVLEAGALLVVNYYVHFDLHSSNLLYSGKTKLQIIDFGMAWTAKDINAKNLWTKLHEFDIEATHDQESPECTLVNAIFDADLKKAPIDLNFMLKEIPRKVKSVSRQISDVLHVPLETQMKQFEEYVKSSIVFRNKDWLDFFKLYWNKFDAWAIGSLLLKKYTFLIFEPSFTSSSEFQTKRRLLESVLRNLLTYDALERYDCVEALEKFAPNSPVLKRKPVAQWLSKAKEQRKEFLG